MYNHNFAIDIKYKYIESEKKYKFSIEFFDRNDKKLENLLQSIKDVFDTNWKKVRTSDREKYINTKFSLCEKDDLITYLEELINELHAIV